MNQHNKPKIKSKSKSMNGSTNPCRTSRAVNIYLLHNTHQKNLTDCATNLRDKNPHLTNHFFTEFRQKWLIMTAKLSITKKRFTIIVGTTETTKISNTTKDFNKKELFWQYFYTIDVQPHTTSKHVSDHKLVLHKKKFLLSSALAKHGRLNHMT